MSEQTKFTPEQIAAAKEAAAHGFVAYRMVVKGQSAEKAAADLAQGSKIAEAIDAKVAQQVPLVKEQVRSILKAA